MNGKVIYDPKQMLAIKNKFKEVGLLEEEFHEELRRSAMNHRNKAKADFSSKAEPYLNTKGRDTTGLRSLIRFRTLKRKNGESAYQVSAGEQKNKIMAYIEFGTRNRAINLNGITKIFGGQGRSYAMRFKGGDNPKNFTHLDARPYFYMNAYLEQKNLMKRLRAKIKKATKK